MNSNGPQAIVLHEPAAQASLTPYGAAQMAGIPQSVDDLMKLATQFARSGYFTDAQEAAVAVAQAVVRIQYGKELGIGPAAAMMGIHIIQGVPSPKAHLLAAMIKRSGKYDYRVRRWDSEACVLEFYEDGRLQGESSFTMDDAKRAEAPSGKNAHNWRKFPRNMLFARALTNGQKIYCPDVFMGPVYSAEELGVEVDSEGNPVAPPAQPQAAPPAAHKPPTAHASAPGNYEAYQAPRAAQEPAQAKPAKAPKPQAEPPTPQGETPDETEVENVRKSTMAEFKRLGIKKDVWGPLHALLLDKEPGDGLSIEEMYAFLGALQGFSTGDAAREFLYTRRPELRPTVPQVAVDGIADPDWADSGLAE